MGSLVVGASDSRSEGLDSMPDATKFPPSTHGKLEQYESLQLGQWSAKCGSRATSGSLAPSQHKWSALNDPEKDDMIIFNAWNSIPDSYDQLKKLAFAVLSLFGSTYICEQSFSSMNNIKSKLRSRLIDENLESCLTLRTT
ncbi:dimer_Tnp_hAT domain-containing protein [Trichonephila clavipes]|nr:dimer_Tnp_hAT domain-containing protein [Trichonephila clavipes]